MNEIRDDYCLVEVFLYHHYQRHGDLILPPMASILQFMRNYNAAIAHTCSQGIFPEDTPYLRIIFPAWNRPA